MINNYQQPPPTFKKNLYSSKSQSNSSQQIFMTPEYNRPNNQPISTLLSENKNHFKQYPTDHLRNQNVYNIYSKPYHQNDSLSYKRNNRFTFPSNKYGFKSNKSPENNFHQIIPNKKTHENIIKAPHKIKKKMGSVGKQKKTQKNLLNMNVNEVYSNFLQEKKLNHINNNMNVSFKRKESVLEKLKRKDSNSVDLKNLDIGKSSSQLMKDNELYSNFDKSYYKQSSKSAQPNKKITNSIYLDHSNYNYNNSIKNRKRAVSTHKGESINSMIQKVTPNIHIVSDLKENKYSFDKVPKNSILKKRNLLKNKKNKKVKFNNDRTIINIENWKHLNFDQSKEIKRRMKLQRARKNDGCLIF